MCTRQNSLFLSFRTRVLALQKDFNKTLFVPQFISLSLSLLSCSVATIISFYIVFHHHHHHQCFFAGFGDGFICAHREECEEKEYEEKECRSLSARCYYAFHSNKNTTTRERKDDDDDSPEDEEQKLMKTKKKKKKKNNNNNAPNSTPR